MHTITVRHRLQRRLPTLIATLHLVTGCMGDEVADDDSRPVDDHALVAHLPAATDDLRPSDPARPDPTDLGAIGFEFCSSGDGDTSSDPAGAGGGSGSFVQQIMGSQVVEVGELPAGIAGIAVKLTSAVDIDIQLYDKETQEKIVGWPNGILSGSRYRETVYEGTRIAWSGYNGDGTGRGNEFIRITNEADPFAVTDRAFIMKVYGYRAGEATIDYSWSSATPEGCTISESGEGSFEQPLHSNELIEIGGIPVGVAGLRITLRSENDIDIQLYDTGDTTRPLIGWPKGMLNGPGTRGIKPEILFYQGMTIYWSGYAGDGTGSGHEYVEIRGVTTRDLTMKVFAFRSGVAQVDYRWGSS